MERTELREYVTDAIAFWERWRLIYNLVLAAIVIIYFAIAYPASKALLSIVIGTLFAAIITRFVAMGMFPGNR